MKSSQEVRDKIAGRVASPKPQTQPKVVLSVEDDNAAFHLIQLALHDLEPSIQLQRVLNGEDALKFLKQEDRFDHAPRPSLVLLNLNLPKVSGPEVLVQMKADEVLKSIPVVVFSSSNLSADRANCLALGARSFLTKPMSYNEFVSAVEIACSYAKAV